MMIIFIVVFVVVCFFTVVVGTIDGHENEFIHFHFHEYSICLRYHEMYQHQN